jgi:type I restriction enzyme R subunit
MNPNLGGRDIREAFKGDDYRILLVANKFQTGFDQPLLCGMYVDKRLAGIQAVQTLSRLNRAHPGKDTTYVLDFVNDPAEVLEAFQTYYETAALETTTDPNIVFDLRAKLDSSGYYDDNEVERVVRVELDPRSKQSDLVAALEPVFDRVMRKHRAAREALRVARDRKDSAAETAAQAELEALELFRRDMGAYLRLYTFLSQIFDYGQTALEKRAIFYKRLIPLLDFERERPTIDLSQVQLTHHALRDRGTGALPLRSGLDYTLQPITEAGAGAVQEREKALLTELIERINELFAGELTDDDKLVYVQTVLKTKLLESTTLQQQAASNTKEQFATSPDLSKELENAIMDAYDAHTSMSQQALSSKAIQEGLVRLLLDYAGLYEDLKARSAARRSP